MRKCNAMIMVFLLLTILSLCKASTLICHEKEKQALLSIKLALTDPTNRLSSWSVNEDCCGWTGVHCDNVSVLFDYNYLKYEDLSLVVKGRKSEYDSILALVRTIDFSSNNLSGSIPAEILSLSGLRFLNLSRNHLIGRIPEKVGSMGTLESLDLSRNHLSGAIPESMANLSFLDHLDLSYNNLSGTIPSSTQLQIFDALSFIGNDELCGAPLTKNCTRKGDFQGVNHIEESREDFELPWFYIGMATGFILSFWGVCGALLFKRTWRHAYFRFLDDTRDKLYVATVLKMNWLGNHLRRHHLGKCLMPQAHHH
ncbi:hypothetical protein PVL29_021367 [Vitis rotundifolia]|uniref:Leucine-rich repeat-containing N-terminal plant-type domain-containing protein n=1 Tax=Vitis rotundifolia TaxID=103349 RepID=A0AA38YZ66_VITRO|nr:hypothetical protein PVL29_021367 [Vitis rotundifolia]